jgi:hypothetical protein
MRSARWIVVAMLALAVGCEAVPSPADTGVLEIEAVAGPVCPVEQEPPDPACAPRAVPEAAVTVVTADGATVAEGTTDGRGRLRFVLPAGDYLLRIGPVEGLFAPGDMGVSVSAGETLPVVVSYDTGIR